MLISMFNDISRPFYQSTDYMELNAINKDKYTEFILKHFTEGKKKIDRDAIEFIFDTSKLFTYYVHSFCNKLYYSNTNSINLKIAKNIFYTILKDNESIYLSYKNLLTNNQWGLLKAIAKDNYAEKPNSLEFIQRHSLGAASTVYSALISLVEKELIVHDNFRYFLPDVFFSEWLKRNAM